VGIALRVDRCYVFQNLRGPDGRLWMDLRGEWDAPDIRPLFADRRTTLHPLLPGLPAVIDVMSDAREINGPVVSSKTPPGVPWRPRDGRHVAGPRPRRRRVVGVRGHRSLLGADRSSDPRRRGPCRRRVAVGFGDPQRADEDARLREDLYRAMIERGPAITYIDGIEESAPRSS
jgi:hypothetical protein